MTLATLEVALFAFRPRNGSEMTRPLNQKNRRKWTKKNRMMVLVSYLRRPWDFPSETVAVLFFSDSRFWTVLSAVLFFRE